LETLVFGARAGRKAAQRLEVEKPHSNRATFHGQLSAFQSNLEEVFARKGKEPCFRLRDEMKAMMTSHVGIFRKESDLLAAREKVRELKKRVRSVGLKQKTLAFNHELILYLEVEGMLHLVEVIVEGALARKESRGAHFRLDYPNRDDEHWLRHTMAFKTTDGLRIDYKDVAITSHPPKERIY